jgi:4-hydroxy-tetrahydrodipicolinate synthase
MHTAQALATLEKVGDQVRVFGGFINPLGLSVLRGLGGDGNIDGGGLGAKFAVAFYEAFWRRDFAAARQAADCYGALMTRLIRPDWSGAFGSPQSQIKACMNMLGQPGGYVRPPLLPIDGVRELEALRRILDDAGLFADSLGPALTA